MTPRSPGQKFGLAIVIAMLLAVPLFAVYLLVYDREQQSETARTSIAAGWGGPQTLAGPLLVLPYRVERTTTETEGDRAVTRTATEWHELVLAPDQLALTTELQPERRARSIYEAVVYAASARGRAVYRLPEDLARLDVAPEQIAFDRAELRFGISDPRGLKPDSRVVVNGAPLAPQPGNGPNATGGAGFFVFLDAGALLNAPLAADFAFALRGNSRLTLVPRAGQTEWTVASSWPHPSFTGAFLPEESSVGGNGFSATYRISNLALGTTLLALDDSGAKPGPTVDPGNSYASGGSPGAGHSTDSHAVRVELIQPVDLYSQVNRAVKYGFLFIGFTFTAFLLFDVVGGRAVAAVEYLLVGAGLVLFFVMLLAFAEVTGFLIAYLIAAAAIVALLTGYSSAVLGSWRRGLLIASLLAGLYATLYVLLSLAAYSLLIGSLLLFAALATVMYLTRSIDWGRDESLAEAGDARQEVV